jgi:hypothetical protein
MTPKERQRLEQLRAAIEIGSFTESDASALLMILRETIGNGPLKELSHHIAHSERDKGRFFKRILANQQVLENLGHKAGVLKSGDLFTVADFGRDLNKSLSQCGLGPLESYAIAQLLVCIMSLLQGCTYVKGKKFAELSVGATSEHICLWATVKFQNKGREVAAKFVVLSVPNRWLPICNPRASIEPIGLLEVVATDGDIELTGFNPFRVQIERDPPITKAAVDAVVEADARLTWLGSTIIRATASDVTASIEWDGLRLTLDGLPEYFRSGSEMAGVIQNLALQLGACVHDDSNAHWFLPGLKIADDGFHSHWVGNAGPTCNRRI